jgi:hypothetical protein
MEDATVEPLLGASVAIAEADDQDEEASFGLVVTAAEGKAWKRFKYPRFQPGYKPAAAGNPLPFQLSEWGLTEEVWCGLLEDLSVNVSLHQKRGRNLRRLVLVFYLLSVIAGSKIPMFSSWAWILIVTYIYSFVLWDCYRKPLYTDMNRLVETWSGRLEEQGCKVHYVVEHYRTCSWCCCCARETLLRFRPVTAPLRSQHLQEGNEQVTSL